MLTIPRVVAHIDRCPECETLFFELLDGVQFALSELSASDEAEPDLTFLYKQSLFQKQVWQTTLDSTLQVIKEKARGFQSLRLSFRLPAFGQEEANLVRETGAAFSVRQPKASILGDNIEEKLLLARSVEIDQEMHIEVWAQRAPESSTFHLIAIVDRSSPDVEIPDVLIATHGNETWKSRFNEEGRSNLGPLPVAALANLDLELLFRSD